MTRNKTTNFSIVIGLCFVACCLSALPAGQVKAGSAKDYQKNRHYGPDEAVDGDPATRWATDTGTKQAWLERTIS